MEFIGLIILLYSTFAPKSPFCSLIWSTKVLVKIEMFALHSQLHFDAARPNIMLPRAAKSTRKQLLYQLSPYRYG